MLSSQMLKGVLEGAILKIISQHETYAYELSTLLKAYGFGDISEGTIYPMLLRLQANGYIRGENKDSTSGPKRKYYYITTNGQHYLTQFEQDWEKLQNAFKQLFTKE